MSSRSARLHWTIAYPAERELIEGFFVGYRSFESSAQTNSRLEGLKLKASIGAQESTFTYKTLRLTGQRLDTESADERQIQQQQADSSAIYLAPVSSVSKSVPVSASPFGHLSPSSQPAPITSQVLVLQTFEFVIGALERDTEYTILIQCFNKKGAGPTSDPVVFRTFANGNESTAANLSHDNQRQLTNSSAPSLARPLRSARKAAPELRRSH